jgi:PAS domain S-box-containing protein
MKAAKRQSRLKGIEKEYSLFMQAPMVIALVKGEDNILELANAEALKLWGKTPDVQGKPLAVAIPEVQGQGIIELLNRVRQTGEPYIAKEEPMFSMAGGKKQLHYHDRVYQPYYEDGEATPSGVLTISHDVTELVQARQKVEESEVKYRTLFDSMDQGFCIIEMIFDGHNKPVDYRFLETNPVFEKQSGLSHAVGKTVRDLVPGLESHWFEMYGQVALTGEAIRFTEGSAAMARWFDVYAFRIGGPGSLKVALLFTDITQRRIAEEKMRQSEQIFRNLVLQAPVAMAVNRGEDLVFDVVNQKMLQLIGRTEEIVGKPLLQAMPELEGKPIIDILNDLLRTGRPFYGNEQLVPLMKDDRWEDRYFNFVYTPLIEGGKVTGVMNVATEVTEQVEARKKIEEGNEELQLAIEIADLGSFRLDVLTNQATNSDKVNEWFGYEVQGYSMQDGFRQIHDDDRDRVLQVIQDSLQSETASRHDITYRVIHPRTGILRHLRSVGKALFNEEGKPYLIVGIIQDITQQVIYQQQMEEGEATLQQKVLERTIELEKRNRELEQFTHVSHHDLQEPLRKILMFTDMVKPEAKEKLSEASQMRLKKVSDAAARMSAALRDVLDYASLNRVEQLAEVDLDETLAAVLADLELVVSEKKASILSDALPSLQAVPGQMHQVMYNLVNNALKFSKPGVPPVIHIRCKDLDAEARSVHPELDPRQHYYHITVQDNGIGFPPGTAEKIFVMFQRLHSKDAYAGTGIGLALCKKAVENHRGKIWAEGQPDNGATFHLILPGLTNQPGD